MDKRLESTVHISAGKIWPWWGTIHWNILQEMMRIENFGSLCWSKRRLNFRAMWGGRVGETGAGSERQMVPQIYHPESSCPNLQTTSALSSQYHRSFSQYHTGTVQAAYLSIVVFFERFPLAIIQFAFSSHWDCWIGTSNQTADLSRTSQGVTSAIIRAGTPRIIYESFQIDITASHTHTH